MWQRTSLRRSPVRRIREWWHESRSLVEPPAPAQVVREPETAWWRTQEELDAAHPGPTTTVAVLRDADADADAVVARLAELAVADELLVVYGSQSGAHPEHNPVITGLRGRLPRHDVVAVRVGHHRADTHRHAAVLEEFMDAGSLPVVVTASAALQDVTAQISSYVRADRVLRVFRTTSGAGLYQVWRRRPKPSLACRSGRRAMRTTRRGCRPAWRRG
ncbi:hypothetical protein EDD30_6779 [Couchioplanes caeruleus]|uniref:Uncharacterized protein n=1 Tax=Couchioplanes caeruleus TaxID=56438 RepID=A0A3N1GTZ1_9ACTN|nr:hypothetical protein EDD30_6779 [Couchioplanes caeruleus]